MFGKRASLAITGSVVHIHNMYRESGDSSGATVRVGKVVRKSPFILEQDFRLIQR